MTKKATLKRLLLIAFILTAITILFTLTTAAETEGYYTYSVSNGEATIIEVDTSISGDITIPSTLGGYPVTSIGDYAFGWCDSLTSITIPDSVISIGVGAFYYCTSLISVMIGNSVESIGYGAFECCYSLTRVTIGDSVESIGEYAFQSCKSLESVIMPDSVLSIGEKAFSYCESLSNVTIGDSVTSIGNSAFIGCSSLTNIIIGNSLESIGDWVFQDCTKLTSVTIPDSVISIGGSAFYGCSGLTSITIGNSVTSIGAGAFSNCTVLTSVTIPDSITSIGTGTFNYCSSLTSVTIPDGVTSIGHSAFFFCSSLRSVTIPYSVTSIENYAFYGCSSLTSVTIGDSVESIGHSTFSGCTSLTSVTIGNNVTSIGDFAFYSCGSLTSVTIPDSVRSIGDEAFRYCDKLETITLLSPTTTIHKSGYGYISNTIPTTTTIYGFAGSTAEAYASSYNRTFAPFASDFTTVFEFSATFEGDAEKAGVYSPIATLNRTNNDGTVAFDFLYAEGASGTLYIKDEVGVYQPLYGSDNNLLMLGEDATPIAVIYDNVKGLVRYYINNSLPRYGENKALAYDLAVSKDFCGITAITDVLTTLDGVDFTNAYTINKSGTAEIVALQENIEDSCSTRLLAGVDMLYYGAVGFETELYIDDLAQNKTSEQSGVVYSSVIADTKTILPSDYGFRYFATLTIEGVDLSDYSGMAVHLIIKPYTQVGTTKYYGSSAKVDITYNDGSYSYAFDESHVG